MMAAALATGCAAGSADSSKLREREESFASQDASDIMDTRTSEGVRAERDADADASDSSGSSVSTSSASSEATLPSSSSSAELDSLDATIESAVLASGMDAGVSVIDLATGDHAGFQSSSPMVSASMIKLVIAAAFLEQVKAGVYSLDDGYILQADDIVGGTGTLGGLGAGASVTYRNILIRMIDVSDNTGANILIDKVGGMEAVNAEAEKLGLKETRLNRYMMDSAAMASGVENYVSADDLAVLLKMVHDGTFVDADSSALLLQALEQQQDYGGVLGGLPDGVTFAHKTGTLASVRHDGGIVEGEHPYVLVILCGGDGFYEQGALNLMAQIASITYDNLG